MSGSLNMVLITADGAAYENFRDGKERTLKITLTAPLAPTISSYRDSWIVSQSLFRDCRHHPDVDLVL
jgi:hypothetical protein